MARRMCKTLFVVGVAMALCSAVSAANILVNGSFDDEVTAAWTGPLGWNQLGYSHYNGGSLDSNWLYTAQNGNYYFAQSRQNSNSTCPAIYQSFSTTGNFTVSGYCRANLATGQGTIRIRENVTGVAGTVKYWNVANQSWVYNTVGFGEPGGFWEGDVFGMEANHSAMVGGTDGWTAFSIDVVALPGVSSYALDIASTYFVAAGSSYTCWDNLSVTAAAVPEPSSILALMLGLTSIGGMIARKKK